MAAILLRADEFITDILYALCKPASVIKEMFVDVKSFI